jgi:hypothetical protein
MIKIANKPQEAFRIPIKTESLFEKANTGTENKKSSLDVSESLPSNFVQKCPKVFQKEALIKIQPYC